MYSKSGIKSSLGVKSCISGNRYQCIDKISHFTKTKDAQNDNMLSDVFVPMCFRYMECNTSITRQRREEVKRLREELLQLQSRLDK